MSRGFPLRSSEENMQGGRRSSGAEFQPEPSYGNPNRGGFNGGSWSPPSPLRKSEIFLKAGRLAAEYLVSKGLLPPNSLPPRSAIEDQWFRGHGGGFGESTMPEDRTSALDQQRNEALDVDHGVRKNDDEYNNMYSRLHSRERRGERPYQGGRGSQWPRGNERDRMHVEREGRLGDPIEEEDEGEIVSRGRRKSPYHRGNNQRENERGRRWTGRLGRYGDCMKDREDDSRGRTRSAPYRRGDDERGKLSMERVEEHRDPVVVGNESELRGDNGSGRLGMQSFGGHPPPVEEENDNSGFPGFEMFRQREIVNVGSTVLEVGANEDASKEVLSESGSRLENHEMADGTISGAVVGGDKILNAETGDETRNDTSGGSKKKIKKSMQEKNARILTEETEVAGKSVSRVENHEMGYYTRSKAAAGVVKILNPRTRSQTRKAMMGDSKKNMQEKDAKILNTEAINGMQNDMGGDSKKKKMENMREHDMAVRTRAWYGDPVSKHGDLLKFPAINHDDLLKSCSHAKVPTKPRSSLIRRRLTVEQGPAIEASNKSEVSPVGASEFIAGEEPQNESNETDTSKLHATKVSILQNQPVGESVDPQKDPNDCLPSFGTSEMSAAMMEDGSFIQEIEKMEEIEKQRYSTVPRIPGEGKCSLQSIEKKSTSYIERLWADELMVEAVNEEKHVGCDAVSFIKNEPESTDILKEEQQLQAFPFEIWDLKLMPTPKIIEIPDDNLLDNLIVSSPILETGNQFSVNTVISESGNTSATDGSRRLASDGKVVPVIDNVDDSPTKDRIWGSLNLESDVVRSNLDNFPRQTEHGVLPDVHDGST